MSSSGQTAGGFRSRPVPSRSGSSSGQGPTGRCPGRSDRASDRVVTPRAGIVVTGTEVLAGRVRDRNGPWLSDRLFGLGVELAHITICGDRPQDIEAQLGFLADQGVDLIVTSGGLGPTADDMTVEGVSHFAGRELTLDEALEDRLAETLRQAETGVGGFDRLEITTCLRGGELEMVTRAEPEDAAAYEALAAFVGERHPEELYSTDGARVDDLVAALLDGRRVATAESCTAGLLAARLTERPGSSEYVAGGVVAYANEAKTELLGVDPAVSVTGIAGPGGGSEDKPVGTVCWSVRLAGGASLTRTALLPGGRSDIRERSTTVAMHLLRRVLSGVEAGVP